MAEKSNEEFIEKYVEDKFYTFTELEALFEQFREFHGGENVPGGPWMQMTNYLGEKMVFAEETYEHFGEEKMLLLIKDAFDPLFEEVSHTEDRSPTFGHAFMPIQNILSRSAKLGYTSIYKYMTDHVNLMDYDIDRMDLHTAIKYHNEDVLDILISKTDDSYGKDGCFTYRIAPETKALEELHTLSNEMKIKLSEHFEWLNIETISGKMGMEMKIKNWEAMGDDELRDLVADNDFDDEDFEACKGVLIARLTRELERNKLALKMEQMKG